MNPNHLNHEQWRTVASSLRARLNTDYRNHLMLCDAWPRAAHSMIQGWRNIASQGRFDHIRQPRRRNTTWQEAAKSMKASLYTRMKSRLLDTTTWQFWASHVPRVELRYIPKRNRPEYAHVAT